MLFSASADPADALVYNALAFNILLSYSILAEVADVFVRDIQNPSRYALEFDFVLSLVNYRSN